MTRQEVGRLTAMMTTYWPNLTRGTDPEALVKAWTPALQDVPLGAAERDVIDLSAALKWPPSVAEVREAAIAGFDRLYHGVDWGRYPAPWAYNADSYDAARRTLYIFDELTRLRPNREAAGQIAEPVVSWLLRDITERVSLAGKMTGTAAHEIYRAEAPGQARRAVTAAVWTSIAAVIGSVWNGIVATIKGCINSILGAANGMISGIVAGLNSVINALNGLSFEIPDWVPAFGGRTFGFSVGTLTAPQIPYLAQGAVIPPNREFLAVLGDQRSGTNVEAPLATIQQAVADVNSDNVAAMMAGFEALRDELAALRDDVQAIRIGDDTLGRSANRYNHRLAMMQGGVNVAKDRPFQDRRRADVRPRQRPGPQL